jgi:hypothetical protein
MADPRTYNVEDRIRELGEDPATAYANAKANGMAGDAPPPTPIGNGSPEIAADTFGEDPPAPVPAVSDPDAALHRAQPGKFKPGGAAAPAKKGKAPELAPIVDTGTLADTQEQLPDMAPVRPTAAPIEPPATFNELFHANSRIAQRDGSTFDDHMLATGYAPIVRALGLDPSENPAEYASLDAAGQARFGNAGQPSRLATAARQGEQMPFGNTFLADRSLQESLIVAEIKKRRATQPDFLKGVPDTVDGLHAYFLAQEKGRQSADEETVARSPGGLTGFAAALGGSVAGTFHDPVNIMGLAIPGGEGKSLIQIAARDALINGVLELSQQPIVAHNRGELGESYTAGDAVSNTFSAAAGGAAFGTALHVGGKAAMATGVPQAIGRAAGMTSNAIADRLFHALPERLQQKWGAAIVNTWARRLDNGEKLDDVFGELSNRELTTLSRTIVGDQHLTPDEKAAGNVLERGEEVGDVSPYQPGPAGDATNENGLAAAIKDLQDRRTPAPTELPSGSVDKGTGAASPVAEPARPPAALSTARRPQPAPTSDPEAAIASFKAKVGGAENNTGNIHAKNPNSSASGPAQFTDGTFRDYYRKVYGQDPGAHPSAELKDNPEVQARLLDRLTRDNASALEHAGESVNEGNLYLAHFLGSGDALRVLKADASTPIERVLSEKVLEANPFLRGKSTSEVAAWANAKMGRQVASVRAGGVLDPASGDDDARIAQLNEEALQLDDQVIGIARKPDGDPVNLYASRVPVSQLNVDAERFQFKAGGDQYGVNDRLRGVEEVDPLALGRLTLWQDRDGRMWVSDGHQRTGLLKREAAATGLDRAVDVGVLREADGVTAEDAMVMAALKNLGEDSGTKIDAAKIGRANADALENAAKRLPKSSALIRDGKALAKLSDEAFGAVVNDVVPADYAAVIGHLLPDRPEAHAAMIDLLAKMDPANRGQAESIVRQAIAAGLHKEEQVDLFGTHSHVTSLMLERAKVLEKVLAKLREAKLVFKTAAEKAGTLEAVGSKIARSASEKEAQANAQALEIVARLAFTRGPIADILNDAAAKLAAGAKLADVAADAARAIRELDPGTIARAAADDAAGRLVPDGAGRGGDTGEEGPQSPSQSGDQEQPSLTELEHATERFSDPDGKAVQQQADSLFHDLKAALAEAPKAAAVSRREQIKAATAELEKAKPGELRTVEPFPKEEPGYHRFRYVAEDGTAVGGNYTLDKGPPPFIEGFNVGDTNNPVKLGPKQVRKLFAEIQRQHPEATRIHAFRMTGARPEAQEMWIDLTGKGGGVKPEDVTVHAGEPLDTPAAAAAAETSARALPSADELDALAEAARKKAAKGPHGTGKEYSDKAGAPAQDYMEGFKAAWRGEPLPTAGSSSRALGWHAGKWDREHGAGFAYDRDGVLDPSLAGKPVQHQAEQAAAAAAALDHGAQTDPAAAERQRQELALRANSPLRPDGIDRVAADDMAGSFRLGDEGDEVTLEDLLKDLDDDDKAIKAMKDCL